MCGQAEQCRTLGTTSTASWSTVRDRQASQPFAYKRTRACEHTHIVKEKLSLLHTHCSHYERLIAPRRIPSMTGLPPFHSLSIATLISAFANMCVRTPPPSRHNTASLPCHLHTMHSTHFNFNTTFQPLLTSPVHLHSAIQVRRDGACGHYET